MGNAGVGAISGSGFAFKLEGDGDAKLATHPTTYFKSRELLNKREHLLKSAATTLELK